MMVGYTSVNVNVIAEALGDEAYKVQESRFGNTINVAKFRLCLHPDGGGLRPGT